MNKQAVADAVRQAIEENPKLTQRSVGQALDVSTATVSKWALGHTMPAEERWADVEKALYLKPGSLKTAYESEPEDPVGQLEKRMDDLAREVASMRRALNLIEQLLEQR